MKKVHLVGIFTFILASIFSTFVLRWSLETLLRMQRGPFTVLVNSSSSSVVEVALSSGMRVRGMIDKVYPEVAHYYGIPYASNSTERFGAPIKYEHQNSQDIFEAFEFGPVCPQLEFFLNQAEHGCLSLNIYAPLRQSSLTTRHHHHHHLKPVLIFFHGGGFFLGGGSEHKLYDGSYMVQNHDVVVVTVNYRLGPLGFLAFPPFGDGPALGNQGIQDQRMAIQWVWDNIEHFGGDRNNINLQGQSAGAYSAAIHLLKQRTDKQDAQHHPLIKRVIMHSAPLSFRFRPFNQTLQQTFIIAKSLKCADQALELSRMLPQHWETVRHCMQKSPIDVLMAKSLAALPQLYAKYLSLDTPFTYVPHQMDGGDFSIEYNSIQEAIDASAVYDNVDIMIGTVRDELELLPWTIDRSAHLINVIPPFIRKILPWKFEVMGFGNSSQWLDILDIGEMSSELKDQWLRVMSEYGNRKGFNLATCTLSDIKDLVIEMLSDYVFICPAQRLLKAIQSSQRKYHYVWNKIPRYLKHLGGSCALNKVCHAVDIPYLFHSGQTLISFDPQEQYISDMMIQSIVDFVSPLTILNFLSRSQRDSINVGDISWPSFDNGEQMYLSFNDTIEVGQQYKSDVCQLWDSQI
ncbi:hypothetical protein MIR68_005475 [Amoeboaphelidium protococcarum]|nr:hypothetical protein MIR68_005475 [Amoeboaphelidium protococcarum]